MKIQEKASTFTSAFFIILAIVIAFVDPSHSMAFIAMLIPLGVFSGLFHANGSEKRTLFHRLDEGFIYMVSSLFLYNTWNFNIWFLLGGALVGSTLFALVEKVNSNVVVPVISGILLAGIFIYQGLIPTLIVLGLALIAAVVGMDSEKKDIRHAIWHILISITLGAGWFVTI